MIRILRNNRTLQKVANNTITRLTQEQPVAVNYVSTRLLSHKLPRFPVPALKQTLEKYLVSVVPFLNQNELQQTEKQIKSFMQDGSTGQKLQSLLEEKAKNSENWLSDWWLHVAYLAYRDPVVIFSNPGQTFPLISFLNETERLSFTANVILGAVDYKKQIDNDLIPPEKMGKALLDMQQYKKVFGTCRIPGEKVDSLMYNPTTKHIAVVHNNHWFRIDIYGQDGKLISKNQLINALKDVMNNSTEKTDNAIGILTSENRDVWGKVYKTLMVDPANRESFQDIQTSMFVLCLDQPMDNQPGENRQTMQSRQLIHGGGSNLNSGNRWFDKTIQFIIGTDGTCGLCYEHSPAEGGPVAVLTDYVFKYAEGDLGSKVPDGNPMALKKLTFNIPAEVKEAIYKAGDHINKLAANLDMYCFTFQHYGKEFIKTQKVSPDSFIQMGLQYTFYRIHKTPPGHYESAGLRQYIHGRTETIRSTSIESVNFAQTMLSSDKSDSEKAAALRKAIASHKRYTTDAVNGYGCDRHLLGLKLMALEKGIQLPELYNDASFKRSTHMRISSSQVPVNCDGFMCYAPLVPDGYGACYNPRANTMNFACSAFKDDPNTSASNWAKNLENSFLDMQKVLINAPQAKL